MGTTPALVHPHPADFWQKPWVQNVLPLLTSATVHATLVIVGLLVWGVAKAVQAAPQQYQTFIPDAQFIENNGMPSVGGEGVSSRQAVADIDRNISEKMGSSDTLGKMHDFSREGRLGDDSAILSAGPLARLGSRTGVFDSAASGDGAGGILKPWGVPQGDSVGPKGPFIVGGRVHQIVFLCDGTGSMLNKMASLKDELAKAVGMLKPIQSFDIVFYQDEKVVKFQDGMINAIPQAKRNATAFLEQVTAEGATDPIPALEFALRLHPQLLFFLTDAADFPDATAVTDTINKYNKDRSIKINTILFVEDKAEHEKNVDSEGLMKSIAQENGGRFRWVEIDAINR